MVQNLDILSGIVYLILLYSVKPTVENCMRGRELVKDSGILRDTFATARLSGLYNILTILWQR